MLRRDGSVKRAPILGLRRPRRMVGSWQAPFRPEGDAREGRIARPSAPQRRSGARRPRNPAPPVSRRAERPPERQRACQMAISRRGGFSPWWREGPWRPCQRPWRASLAWASWPPRIGPQYHSPRAVFLTLKSVSDDRVRAIGQASLGQRFVSVLLEAAAQDRGKRRSLDGRGNEPEIGRARSDCASRRRRYVQLEGLPARGRDRQKTMTLPVAEFIRRFLIHVLPSGFSFATTAWRSTLATVRGNLSE